ncbi:MAG: leucyl/phenylalanyl-tRNA--protein transferase [Acidiferrobacterales bacterium]|nr:leucyl/phenylalanyl-tRNA--protein transferase [Acidiferrobacterales bacterium]
MITVLSPDLRNPGFPELDSPGDQFSPVAVGGDLSVERLLMAYSRGIFPWFSNDELIFWWSPDPRLVVFPERFKVSRSLRKSIRNRGYSVTINKDFEAVIRNCATTLRPGEERVSTWITNAMIDAYCELSRLGHAHSVETWHDGQLVGGLYGVSLGKVFFGESMFSTRTDASKVALCHLVAKLREWNFVLIDCQIKTSLLSSMGAEQIERTEFLTLVRRAIVRNSDDEDWT